MRKQARRLRYELKSGTVADHGRAYGANTDDLIEALMQLPENLGPTVASVYEWVEKRKGRAKYGQRLQMIWYASRITELDWSGIILERPVAVAK
jgi:hypothetical protein